MPQPLQQQPSVFGGRFAIFAAGSYQTAAATQSNGGVPLSTTNVAGWQLGLRVHGNDYNAFEFRFSFAQPTQTYGSNLSVRFSEETYSLDYVRTIPLEGSIRPFFLGGVSIIHYIPVGANNTVGSGPQVRPGIDYGAGLDWKLTPQLSLRIEYRGIIYRLPDFDLIGISQWNHMPVPDVGLEWHF
ncbi:MAG: outer membrane beta-barrel protein [Terriglobales bacterium]